MSDESNIERILAYVETHRASYPLDALRQQLLTAGYSSADVDAAFARLEAPATTPATPVIPTLPAEPAVADAALAQAEDARSVQQMVEYLRQHGNQYETEALRQQLLAAGQRPELVDQAVQRAALTGPQSKNKEPLGWPLGILVALANLLLLPALFGSVLGLFSTSSNEIATLSGFLPLLVLVAEGVAGFVLLRGPRRRLGKALLWGVVFSIVIPLILVLLLLGICLVLIGGSSGSLFR